MTRFSSINFSDTGPVIVMPNAGSFLVFVASEESFIPSTGLVGVVGGILFPVVSNMHAVPASIVSWPGTLFPVRLDAPASLVPSPLLAAPATSPVASARGGWMRLDASGGPIAQTLPAISGAFTDPGVMVAVTEESGTPGLTIAPSGGNTLNGSAAAVAIPGRSGVLLIGDGISNWTIVSNFDLTAYTVDAALVTATPNALTGRRLARYDTTAGNIVANLPAASSLPSGAFTTVKNEVGGNSVNTTPDGADTIDSVAALSAVASGIAAQFVTDGVSNWTRI